MRCRICSQESTLVGRKYGRFAQREFQIRGCLSCGFIFVADPWTDFDAIYSEAYYAGKGVDPMVDYLQESRAPESTIRSYEWQGIASVIGSLYPCNRQIRWLDFGAGTGGLVRYCRETLGIDAVGYELSRHARSLAHPSTPFIESLDDSDLAARFDIVTGVEVIEHVLDPVAVLRSLRRVLKPGGVLFLTTGNVEPWQKSVLRWRYLTPEIHISLFTPLALEVAFQKAGISPRRMGYLSGYDRIIRFKVLKSLGFRRVGRFERLMPWKMLSALADRFWAVTDHPVGFAPPPIDLNLAQERNLLPRDFTPNSAAVNGGGSL